MLSSKDTALTFPNFKRCIIRTVELKYQAYKLFETINLRKTEYTNLLIIKKDFDAKAN